MTNTSIVNGNAAAFMQALMNNVVQFSVGAAINSLRSSQGMGSYVPPPPVTRF